MKYTIEGFSQVEAIRLGLDVKDLVLLRWIVDFYNTGKMDLHLVDGNTYFWVDYRYLIAQLPIIGISSSKVLSRRMKHLQDCEVLQSVCRPDSSGVRMYFRFLQETLLNLLSQKERQMEFEAAMRGRHSKVPPSPAVAVVGTQKDGGRHSKVLGVGTQKYRGVDSSINDSSIRYIKGKPIPPNLEAVKAYCKIRENKVDPEAFIDHYQANGWVQGNRAKPVVDWQACIRTWEKKNFEPIVKKPPAQRGPSAEDTDKYLESLRK